MMSQYSAHVSINWHRRLANDSKEETRKGRHTVLSSSPMTEVDEGRGQSSHSSARTYSSMTHHYDSSLVPILLLLFLLSLPLLCMVMALFILDLLVQF